MPSEYYEKKVKSIKDFDYNLDYRSLDLRQNPQFYKIGRGEQGVLMVQPYKSEILPFWKFRTPEIAQASAEKIYELFLKYLENKDFIGADMARKFLQMGYTRSRRYANHSSGKKYISNPQNADNQIEEKLLRENQNPQESDFLTNEKAQSARIFYGFYKLAKENIDYQKQMQQFKEKYY